MVKHCRFCNEFLKDTFLDLGLTPISNAYVRKENLNQGEIFYPLHAWVCNKCMLVQLEEFERVENIFNENYAYFSSYSLTWLNHAKRYSQKIIEFLKLDTKSQVVEIASNDGYLLKNFVELNVPALGIEPAANTAAVAINNGIPTWNKFFGIDTAKELVRSGYAADLLIGNNVLAHVPDINDFVQGLNIALKANGVITLEFPHILRLIKENQFDTIYHEHFSYLSLITLKKIFTRHKLEIFKVEELETHGGSLRIYVQHEKGLHALDKSVALVESSESAFGLDAIETYTNFSSKVADTKRAAIKFLMNAKEKGLRIAGYGAPAKGNTFLNYCGIGKDIIEFTVDANPHKQGTWLPGTRIPVYSPDMLRQLRPDLIIVLPWNLKKEISQENAFIKEWGGKFVTLVPYPEFII